MKSFKESQSLRQPWLWILLGLALLGAVFSLVFQVFTGNSLGNNPLPSWALGLIVLLLALLLVSLARLELHTSIDAEAIAVNYGFLGSYRWRWEKIQSVSLCQYGFVGYGKRYSREYGTILNAQGRQGLQIILKNGRKFLVGTQKSSELKQFLIRLKKMR